MVDFNMANHRGNGRKTSKRFSRNGSRNNSRNRPSNRGSSGRGNFKRRDFRPKNIEEQTPHTVTCDGCGEKCEVPFKPTSDKPVYCTPCFRNAKGPKSENGTNSPDNLNQINEKLDKILALLNKN